MLSMPMVQCSHNFARINLDDQLRSLNAQNNDNQQNPNPNPNNNNNINNSNNNNSDNGNNSNNDSRSNSNNSQISIKSIIEMHGLRMNRRSWLNDQSHEHHISSLSNMNLRDFCKKIAVGRNTYGKNKICSHLKRNYVPVFYLKLSSDREDENYYLYCKYALIKCKPWVGEVRNAHGGDHGNNESNIVVR